MSRGRYVAWRVAWAVVAVYLVLSATFVLVAATPDPNKAMLQFAAAKSGDGASGALSAYEAARNQNVPILERYANFVVDFATLNWGTSFETGRPVTGMVAEGTFVTALYLVPSILLAVTGATYVGIVVASRDSRLLDLLTSGVSYAGFGVPNFWLAAVVSAFALSEFGLRGGFALSGATGVDDPTNPLKLVFPILVLSTTLFGTLVRHVRAEIDDQLAEEYVKTARSKGAGHRRAVRHALRNAALPLVTLLFTELLGVLFLSGFVIEYAFGVHGLMQMAFEAIDARDVPMVIGTALVPVTVGIVGNLLQDVLYATLDPRVTFGGDRA